MHQCRKGIGFAAREMGALQEQSFMLERAIVLCGVLFLQKPSDDSFNKSQMVFI
jgi:hypothetical protein